MTLYLVGTPIGNLEDMTFRAVRILKEVDMIACEDTRVTGKLTHHYDIDTKLISYHEHNKDKMTHALLEHLQNGSQIALVSDAGLPLISDPGYELVLAVRAAGIKVETVPGPNAALTALMTSGLSSYSFMFYGFLPRKDNEKIAKLEQLMAYPSTVIIYESPYRVKHTLQTIEKLDATRQVSIARELTKKFEQVVTLPVSELLSQLEDTIPLKGEFVILIDGQYEVSKDDWWKDISILEHIEHYISEGLRSKEAIKQVALDRDEPKREIYNIYHQ